MVLMLNGCREQKSGVELLLRSSLMRPQTSNDKRQKPVRVFFFCFFRPPFSRVRCSPRDSTRNHIRPLLSPERRSTSTSSGVKIHIHRGICSSKVVLLRDLGSSRVSRPVLLFVLNLLRSEAPLPRGRSQKCDQEEPRHRLFAPSRFVLRASTIVVVRRGE